MRNINHFDHPVVTCADNDGVVKVVNTCADSDGMVKAVNICRTLTPSTSNVYSARNGPGLLIRPLTAMRRLLESLSQALRVLHGELCYITTPPAGAGYIPSASHDTTPPWVFLPPPPPLGTAHDPTRRGGLYSIGFTRHDPASGVPPPTTAPRHRLITPRPTVFTRLRLG